MFANKLRSPTASARMLQTPKHAPTHVSATLPAICQPSDPAVPSPPLDRERFAYDRSPVDIRPGGRPVSGLHHHAGVKTGYIIAARA